MIVINRVENSSLITIDLEDFLLTGERVLLDIKQQLWQEIALKEKDFRQYIKETDWSVYQDKYVALTCSVDAIIPTWAYMLLTTAIAPFAKRVVFGDLNYLETLLLEEAINKIDFSEYQDARIVIKGCSNKVISPSIYVKVTEKLQPYVKVIMYGEPCSTVPLWKKQKS